MLPESQVFKFLEEFEKKANQQIFLVDDNLFDAIYFHKINLTAFPQFNKIYTEFLESFL